MEDLSFHLEAFDGPLNLLLHLINKNKVNIYDIPISKILSQYMEYIDEAKRNNIEIASSFVLMAAHLVHIKSKMLLPKSQDKEQDQSEEYNDPREPLVEMLLEYQRIQAVMPYFVQHSKIGNDIFVRDMEALPRLPVADAGNFQTQDLVYAFTQMCLRTKQNPNLNISSFKNIVGREKASVVDKINMILQILCNTQQINLYDIFKNTRSRSEIVASFLAVLELSKDCRIKVYKKQNLDYTLTLAEKN